MGEAPTGYLQTRFKGRAWKFGPHIDTDMIMPGKYLAILDPKELAKHVLEGADPEFATKKVQPGDIIVADENFGCGSSREHAPVAIQAAGVPVVLAETFARIFFRNSINIGVPLLEVKGIAKATESGNELEVDLETGLVRNITTGARLQAKPLPPNVLEILRVGGLVNKVRIARGLEPLDPKAPRKLAAAKSE